MANEEYCHEGKPMYYNSAGLTAVHVLSLPAPPGPRSLHGGKSSVVPSLLVRTPSTLAFLRHASHQGYPGHFRRKPPRGRHQPIPSIRGVLATPRRLTALADIAGLQLLWGPQGRPMPSAYCILAAGQAPGHPVGWCSGAPRPVSPDSAISGDVTHSGSPPRARQWRS